MGLILNIDTSGETALVCLAENGKMTACRVNEQQKDHAGFLQPAITGLLADAGAGFTNIAAVAVTDGPGSYTGLRVGMASAKGLCYALQVPLITIGTLQLMAVSAQKQHKMPGEALFCPMIDARRMEVFTAVYNQQMEEKLPPSALIIDENAFGSYLQNQPMLFTGSGAAKWKAVCTHKNAFFENINISPEVFCHISYQLFENQQFSNLAYAEPRYVKAFYTTQKRQAQ
jgi:tRNA threonylcarbamoyladenosine biosynthesis protein TsaB